MAGFSSATATPMRLALLLAVMMLCLVAIEAWPQDNTQAEKDFAFAEGLYGQENYTLALEKYAAFIKAWPNHANMPLALFRAGECNFRLGRYADAVPWFRQVTERYPESDTAEAAWLWLGDALYQSGQYAEAVEAYESLLRKFPDSHHAAAAAYWRAESYYHLQRYQEAIDAYRDALGRKLSDNEIPYALYSMGLAYLQLDQPAAALGQFTEVLERYPNSPVAAESQYLSGNARAAQGDLGGALAAYSRVLTAYSQSPFAAYAAFAMAGVQFRQGEYEQALAAYERIGADYSDSAVASEAALRRGDCLFHLGRWEEAAAAYERVAADERSPWAAEALYWLGVTRERQGRADEALRAHERLIATNPQNAHVGDAWLHIGMLRSAAGDHTGAVAAYEAAVKASDDPTRRQQAEAALYWERYQLDRSAEALAALEQMVRAQPAAPLAAELAWRVGHAHFEAERYQAALEMLGMLITNHPEHAHLDEALYLSAICQEKLAKPAEAEQLYRRLLDRGGDAQFAAYAQAALVGLYASRGETAEARRLAEGLQARGADANTVGYALYTVAEALRKAERHQDAAELYQQALQAAPAADITPWICVGLGWAQLALGQANAGAAFVRVLDEFAGSDAAVAALEGLMAVGQKAFAAGDYGAAAQAYDRIIATPGGRLAGEACYGKAWVLLRQDKPDEALPLFLRAIESAGSDEVIADARYQAARLLAGKDDARAVTLLEPLRSQTTGERTVWALVLLGQVYNNLQQPDRAAEVLEKVLGAASGHEAAPAAQLALGRTYRLLKRYDEAVTVLTRATEAGNARVAMEAQFELAAAHQDKGALATAAEEFLKVAILYRDPAWAARGQFAAGQCFEQLGDREAALRSYKVIVDRYPEQSEWLQKAQARIQALGG